MLEQRSKAEAGTSGYKDRRRMLLALLLLLTALLVVVVKNREIWFGSDDDAIADETPAWIPGHVVPTPAVSTTAPIAQANPHVAVKAPTQPAVAGAAVVATTRTVLQPLGIEVVAGGAHQAVHAVSNSVKVEMLSDSTGPATQEWSLATNAADRTRLASTQALVSPESSYPLLAQQMKVQGSVLLQVLIGADGAIRDLRVLNGPAILASAARDAVRQWRFKPYMQNGHAVETSANVTVNFTINVLDKATRDQLGPVALATSGE
jgi:TonB family protein